MLSSLLNYLSNQLRMKRREVKQIVFDRDKMVTADSARATFSRDGKEYAILDIKSNTVRVTSLKKNPNRETIFKESGKWPLQLYYYTDNPDKVYISCGQNWIGINRDSVSGIRRGLQRYLHKSLYGPHLKDIDPNEQNETE